jgi:hypothetical protein
LQRNIHDVIGSAAGRYSPYLPRYTYLPPTYLGTKQICSRNKAGQGQASQQNAIHYPLSIVHPISLRISLYHSRPIRLASHAVNSSFHAVPFQCLLFPSLLVPRPSGLRNALTVPQLVALTSAAYFAPPIVVPHNDLLDWSQSPCDTRLKGASPWPATSCPPSGSKRNNGVLEE